jgi:hypothetical protein
MNTQFSQRGCGKSNVEQTVQQWLKAISVCYAISEKSTDQLRKMLTEKFDSDKCPDRLPPAYLCKQSRDFRTDGFELQDCQCRYLVTMCDCNQVERLRQHSIESVKACNWIDAADYLCAATNELSMLIHERDAWWATMLLAREAPTLPVGDGHAVAVVEMLYRNIEILRLDTTDAYETALRRLESRLQKVQKKLTPMMQERDKVRTIIGEARWTENRQPKNDFVGRRKTLEAERRSLSNALGILYGLHIEV